jgi:hypothetical protein
MANLIGVDPGHSTRRPPLPCMIKIMRWQTS